jgi:formamidopyrimidine-DNA glycosylase
LPELPEVETTRRGIEPHLAGHRIAAVRVRDRRLRWPVTPGLERAVGGQRVRGVRRRAKYLLIDLERGALIVHLGMSGSLRVVPPGTPARKHDHVELGLEGGAALRLHDPRRFGCFLYTTADPAQHALLRGLAPEPLEPGFDGNYLHRISRRRRVGVKLLLMNAKLVTGVGNIYASEALFRAHIRPGRRAASLTRAECTRLARAVRGVLSAAIRAGGTTLRDYYGAGGEPGLFRLKLYVYERAGQPCRRCRTPVRRIVQGQRSTYYCARCQQ